MKYAIWVVAYLKETRAEAGYLFSTHETIEETVDTVREQLESGNWVRVEVTIKEER